MTHRLTLFLLALLTACTLHAQLSPGFRWGVSGGGPDFLEYTAGIDLDANGNVYTCGTYRAGAVFGDSTLSAAGTSGDFFTASYDRRGDFRWVFHTGGSQPDEAKDIYAKVEGSVFVTGFAKGAILGPGEEEALHARDFYVVRLDTSGNVIWQRNFNGDNYGEGQVVVADGAANCYVAGIFKTQMYLPSGDTLFSNGGADVFVAKFTPTGSLEWIHNFGSATSDDAAYGIGLDATGCVYFGGFFQGTISSGPVNLTSYASKDAFIMKLNPAGDAIWGTALRGRGVEQVLGMDVTPAGHIYAAGTYSDSLFLPGDTLLSAGGADSWAARLDSTGSLLWLKPMNGVGLQSAQDISVNAMEQLFTVGFFSNTVTFDGGTPLTSSGYDDIFIYKMDSSGNLLFGQSHGYNLAYEFGQSIQGDANGNFVFGGLFGPTLALDTVTLNSFAGSEDAFAALWCDSLTLSLTNVSGPPHCLLDAFTVSIKATGCFDPDNVFYVEMSDNTGSFASPDTVGILAGCFGGDISCIIPASVTGGSGYVVRVASSAPALVTPPSSPPFAITTSLSDPVVITGDTVICVGDTVTLDAGAGYVSYNWSTGEFTQTIVVTIPGLYTVEVQDSNGCTTMGEHSVSLCVGMEEGQAMGTLMVYPNPNQGEFRVSFDAGNDAPLQMFDMEGREVEVDLLSESVGVMHLRMTHLVEGIYWIRKGSEGRLVLIR